MEEKTGNFEKKEEKKSFLQKNEKNKRYGKVYKKKRKRREKKKTIAVFRVDHIVLFCILLWVCGSLD